MAKEIRRTLPGIKREPYRIMQKISLLFSLVLVGCDSSKQTTPPASHSPSLEGSQSTRPDELNKSQDSKASQIPQKYVQILNTKFPAEQREQLLKEFCHTTPEAAMEFLLENPSLTFLTETQIVATARIKEIYPAIEFLASFGPRVTPKLISSLLKNEDLHANIVLLNAIMQIEGKEKARSLVREAVSKSPNDKKYILQLFK